MKNPKSTKHAYVYTEIINNIKNDKYNTTKKLPSEKELAEEFNVSVNTIRKALTNLIIGGHIVSRHGSGYYLNEKDNINVLTTLSLTETRKNVTNEILTFEIKQANEVEAQKLNIELNEAIFYIKRLRKINNKPYLLENTIVPVKFVPSLTKEVFEHSFYKYLESEKNLKIDYAIKEISPLILNSEDTKILKITPNKPILVVENFGFLSNGEQFEYSYNIHTDEKFSVIINNTI
ncbi:MAG: GntR family transcriptional regulator [Mycoplasmatales bacterium]